MWRAFFNARTVTDIVRLSILLLLVLCGCPSTSGPADASSPFDAGPRPDGPTFGEVSWWHLALPAGVVLPLPGEAGILVGPDGTMVLVDIGNSNHDDDVISAIRELNTQWLTPERGYRVRAPTEVDWIVLTHFHADHIGSFTKLTTGPDPIVLNHGVVHRGFVDVGAGLNEKDFEALCMALRGEMADKNFAMCTASPESPCVVGTDPASATSCPGLLLGNLGVTGDEGQPSFIDLGGGAKLKFLGADNFVLQGTTPVMGTPFGVDKVCEENARSIVGLVEHGPFRLLFGGDLTGSGQAGEPDVESFVVDTAPEIFGTLGIDYTHANHHARDTSSNAKWVNASAPNDGRTRSAFSGFNVTYVDSPQQGVIDAWTANGRLGFGKLWVTERGPAAGKAPDLIDLDGTIHMQTVQQGAFYFVEDLAAPAVRTTQ